jgi:hypothetical protein
MAYGDGLYQFKKKFGGIEHYHTIITQVYNRPVYAKLCESVIPGLGAQRFPQYGYH